MSGVALNLDATDRRRLGFTAIATLVALPVVWLFAKADAAQRPTAPRVANTQESGDANVGRAGEPFGENGPIFIDGPTTPQKPAVIQIVVPAVNPGASLEGGASYNREVGVVGNTCSAPAVAAGTLITVTNRDNGRVVSCTNVPDVVTAPKIVIVLSSTLFAQIGALVDAPIPVRLTW